MARASNRPEPARCPRCKRLPVVVQTRPGLWRVACPFPDCDPIWSAWGGTEKKAVENWNEEATKK